MDSFCRKIQHVTKNILFEGENSRGRTTSSFGVSSNGCVVTSVDSIIDVRKSIKYSDAQYADKMSHDSSS
jgi:hypothetical protein